jgi:hypothetical protein
MAKLLNLSNPEAPALSSHQAAIDAKWAAAAALESCFSASTLTAIPDPVGYQTLSPGKRDAQAAALSSSLEEIGHRKKGKSKAKGQYHQLLGHVSFISWNLLADTPVFNISSDDEESEALAKKKG